MTNNTDGDMPSAQLVPSGLAGGALACTAPNSPPAPSLNRRALFGAIPAIVLAAPPAGAVAHPDAELIEACRRFRLALAAVNAPGSGNADESPEWEKYMRLSDVISETSATTWEGWHAKALAAKAEAATPNGDERPDHTIAAEWAWDLVHDALRLGVGRVA